MHNHDDKYPARPAFEPGTSRLQAPVNTNEPLWMRSYVAPVAKTGFSHRLTAYKFVGHFFGLSYLNISGRK